MFCVTVTFNCDSDNIRGFTSTWVTAITPNRQSYKISTKWPEEVKTGCYCCKITYHWFMADQWLLARIDWASEWPLPVTCASNWDNWGYLRTLTGPRHGWFGDFRQELTGCQKQLCPKFEQVAEIIGDTRILLMDLEMTFHHAIGVKLVWNHRFDCYLKSYQQLWARGFRWCALYTRIDTEVRTAELDHN